MASDNLPGGSSGNNKGDGSSHEPKIKIRIDRADYEVDTMTLTGAEIRALPTPPIGPDRDVFEVIPGGSDRKIETTDTVEMRHGLRFFTAPAQINPGA